MGKRDHFSFKEIAIFHQVAPIKNSLTIILCARSAENFVPLQTLFSYLKIAIFSRIAPQIKSKLGARSADNFLNTSLIFHEKSVMRNAFSLLKMAIFFKIAPTYFHRGNEREEHSLSNNCHIVPLENSL